MITKRRRQFLAALRRRRIREAGGMLYSAVRLANTTLRLAHAEFIFLCPRCWRLQRVARVRVVPLPNGLNVQHEAPVCDMWKQRAWRGVQ